MQLLNCIFGAMITEHLQNLLKTLPEKPGVYQHLDAQGKILYIGKAKNLKKRVASYFNKGHLNMRTRVMVRKVTDIKTIVTETELDALLLENVLIKEHQPRYNVNLKDDKTYPWLVIKNERFPRVFPTRNKIKDGSEYYGPYANVKVMRALLQVIKQLYPLRTCNLLLNEENIAKGKYKVCLEFHLKNCKGPCEDYQSETAYNEQIAAVRNIIKGHISEVKAHLKGQMLAHAERMEFEAAQAIKDKLDLVTQYQAKSIVVNPAITNVEVFSCETDAEYGYINLLRIVEGAVVFSHTVEVKKKLEETPEELLTYAIPVLRERFQSQAKTVFTSAEVDLELPGVEWHVPQRGDKKQLVDLSLKNARHHRVERLKNIQIVDPDRHVNRLMTQMKADLRLPEEPRHIECFDNSNIQGTHPVAACVVFKNGKPSKKEYRHFNIKTVEGPDDFASMEEVVFRRYSRMLEEGSALPQLIVIDGGKGQLGAALESLEKLGLRGTISIIGIAKRLEEIFFPGDPIPIYLDKRSETLKVIQMARNEAHRFGITHHRNRRSKTSLNSELEAIDGIGPAAIKQLFVHFKSVAAIKQATLQELTAVVGLAKAQKITGYFSQTS
jgi:excinuclease ABC subunit C